MENTFNFKKQSVLRLGTILLAGIVYLVVLFLFHKYNITREQLDIIVGPMQKYGLILLFFLQVIFSLTPFPDNFLIYTGVIVFGPVETFFAIYFSYLIATSLHFWIARKLGKDWVFRKFPKIKLGMEKHDHLIKGSNLILYRFLAFNTFDILAYLAGFSNISYRSYIISSIVSMPVLIIPGILLFQGLLVKNPLNIFLTYLSALLLTLLLYFISKKAEGLHGENLQKT